MNAATIGLLVALANTHGWDLRHFNMEQAFIQSDFDFEIYMRVPPGCGSMSGNIILLNRSIYWLKQSARQLYKFIGVKACEKLASSSVCRTHAYCDYEWMVTWWEQ